MYDIGLNRYYNFYGVGYKLDDYIRIEKRLEYIKTYIDTFKKEKFFYFIPYLLMMPTTMFSVLWAIAVDTFIGEAYTIGNIILILPAICFYTLLHTPFNLKVLKNYKSVKPVTKILVVSIYTITVLQSILISVVVFMIVRF